MSDSGPPGGDPFGGIPFLEEMMRLFTRGAAGSGADAARQIALSLATDGEPEPNVEPADRLAVGELARVAELRVTAVTGLSPARDGRFTVEVVNRGQWAGRTLDDYRQLFDDLAGALSAGAVAPEPDTDDPFGALIAQMGRVLGPVMAAMTTGSLVGHLARRALDGHELPVPRPPTSPSLVCLPNVDAFGREWSLDRDELRLWVCLHEVATATVLRVPHIRRRLDDLLHRHATSFVRDPEVLEQRLGGIDLTAGPEALERLQEHLGDPEVLLGAVRSPAQEALQPELTAVVAAVTGYVDHVMDRVGAELISTYGQLTEALRRRRVEADRADRFVERLLGLELDQRQYDRGTAFARGVVERAGDEALDRLVREPHALPTPAEIDAPGLWLERIDLPG